MPLSKLLRDEKRSAEHQAFLLKTGLTMPDGKDEDFGYTEQIGPYAVFHHLWRYAAYLEVKGGPPADPGTHPLDDPIYQEAIARPKTRFEHLLRHSEEYGYYYPIDFPDLQQILMEPEGGFLKKLFGGGQKNYRMVSFGSAQRLQKELLDINECLKVPVREEMPSETYADGIHGELWGDEMWTWIVLYFMSRKAIEHGQIVVFE